MTEAAGKNKDNGASKSTRVSSYYEISGGSVKRKKKSCPKCGPGFFMSEHKDRFSCGKCGYTEFKSK